MITLALAALAPPSDVAAAGPDPAARGLDIFVDLPSRGAPGTKLPVQLQALGFPTASTLAPLVGAEIEAVWDPESLGPAVATAPPAVTAKTDAAGRLHLDVPIPEGDERSLRLLVGATYGDHHRTAEFSVHRVASRDLTILVPDRRVVPGGVTSAWVIVRDTGSGEPSADEEVVFELLEGGVPRFTLKARTDAAGTAMARVPVPWTDEPALSWKLSARSRTANVDTASGSVVLVPREETPGEPQLLAWWSETMALPGDKVGFTLRLRDASDRPVAGGEVRYWIGPKGTEPPDPARDLPGWKKASVLAATDLAGEIKGSYDAPKTVRKGATSSLRIVARAELFGRGLRAEQYVSVTASSPYVDASPEIGKLVPGVEQALVVSVRDPRNEPVAGTFVVQGDGLDARVTTDRWGQAEVRWKVPRDVGAARNIGPCAGGVAATVSVRPTASLPQLEGRTDPFTTCVTVSREVQGLLRVDRPLAVAGTPLAVSVVEAPAGAKASAKAARRAKDEPPRAWSVKASPEWFNGARSAGAWLDVPADGAAAKAPPRIELPMLSATPGTWSLSGAEPSLTEAARIAAGGVIVAPKLVPKVVATLAGGRAAPNGTVDIDVDLSDGKGHGAPGSIAAVLVDAFGGGNLLGLVHLDTRGDLCGKLGVPDEDCDAFFDDPAAETLRKRILSQQTITSDGPSHDPAATAKGDLQMAFRNVLLSLEGAVMDATRKPDSLRDAFRKEKSAFAFNPELFSLVTAAMDPPPETPGGEPIVLGDLVAIDRQVTYDNVARRVTRLKLFNVLARVRAYRQEKALDPDEPVLGDPNAILRRLARDGMDPQDLVDPWGGTMAFVKSTGARMPFINVKGFELHAPGPDGKIGTGDDVKNPFERVVASGTPYATAMDEDRLVDAALDMEVSQATVDAWQSTLSELTGQTLGDSFGAGGVGYGTGLGAGHGSLRGGHVAKSPRVTFGISSGAAFWMPPTRTDAKGHLRIQVPLGDVETTWRLALVGAPDGATPAVTTLDIPSALPMSVRVEAGAAWIEGDEASVVLTVRNRTAAPAKIDLAIAASGAVALVAASDAARSVEVPAGGAANVDVRVRAKSTGAGSLDVAATGPGGLADRTTHSWQVRPAGEAVDLMSTQWVEGHAELALSQVGPGLRATGSASVVLERGNASAIAAALVALEPDGIRSLDGLTYAQEAAARIQKWAIARGGDGDPLAARAADLVRRSIARLLARREVHTQAGAWSALRRAVRWAPPDLVSAVAKIDDCPDDTSPDLGRGLAYLEAEPSSADGAISACWDSLAANMIETITSSGDRVALARALLAFAERPQRALVAASLADKLRAWVDLQPSGRITLPPGVQKDRAARSTVFAALLRASRLGAKPLAATPDRLAAWLRVQRDAQGSYGSPVATLAAVRALVASPAESTATAKVTIVADGLRKEIDVGPDALVTVPLGAKPLSVALDVTGPGVVARLLRPGLRLWSSPPDTSGAPIALDVTWPEKPTTREKATLVLSASSKTGNVIAADVRVPLPPGVTLAEGGTKARQVQGALVIPMTLDSYGTATVMELPVRFGLAGKFTVPEARARIAYEEGDRTIAPARPLVVK